MVATCRSSKSATLPMRWWRVWRQQAVRHGCSVEAEHRLILEQALFPERRPGRRLLEVL
jgi:plasmid stability protein